MDAESPLKVLPKITYDHISLTPYSVIRVDLAAQILNSTMVSVLSHHGGNELSGTSKYWDMIDNFLTVWMYAVLVNIFENAKIR